ncbi:hypothetical protein SALBM135S_03517 [Streptomyces alboniger]
MSHSVSASYPWTSAQSESAWAYAIWAASSSTVMILCSAASTAFAASRILGCATETSRSRTVLSSRTEPTNCGITPSPPLTLTLPPCGWSSPEISRSSVVLPAPFAPTRATTEPSPTRKETSPSSARPSGK